MNKKWLIVSLAAGLMSACASPTIAQSSNGQFYGSRMIYEQQYAKDVSYQVSTPHFEVWQNVSSSFTQQLPADAQALIAQYRNDAKPIRREAGRKIRELQAPLLVTLKQMQDRYTRDANLDEAVAIRDYRRMLQESHLKVLPDPGALYQHQNVVGQTFFFRVTGSTAGAIWGTDIYTADSTLPVAAVHAGVLKLGQTGIVKVTILPPKTSYQASTRNGIQSGQWNEFPGSYKVEPVSDDDQADDEPLSDNYPTVSGSFRPGPGSQGFILPNPPYSICSGLLVPTGPILFLWVFQLGQFRPRRRFAASRPGHAASRRRSPYGRTRRCASGPDPKRSRPQDPQTPAKVCRGPEATARQVHPLGHVGRSPGHSPLDSHSSTARRQRPA